MAYNALPAFFPIDYSTSWEARIERRESDFYSYVKKIPMVGEKKRFNQSGLLEMQKKTGRANDTRISERELFFRWVQPEIYDLAELIDEWDEKELGNIALPDSDSIMQHVDAYNRKLDATIRDAIQGNATVGEDGTTLQAVTQTVVDDFSTAGTASSLNLAKLLRVNRYFKDNDLKREKKCFAISPEAEDSLLLSVNEAKSSDFVNIAPIVDGTLEGKTLAGLHMIVHTGLSAGTGTNQAGTIEKCLAWTADQIRFCDGERRVFTDIRQDKEHALQIRSTARMGAYRNEEKAVVVVESATA
jgi:hypothetical protein